ncbi:ankyrin repeat protein, partial [Rhexocercosporidium sp. MPI-PUGE-AT-0058]
LRIAAVKGNVQMVVLMLEAGADVNAVAEDGGTALQLAASYKHEGVVDLLLDICSGAGVDVNAVNDISDTALSCAVLRGYENFVKLLLDRGADWKVGRNPLTIAVSRQHLNIARELLNRGARPG